MILYRIPYVRIVPTELYLLNCTYVYDDNDTFYNLYHINPESK